MMLHRIFPTIFLVTLASCQGDLDELIAQIYTPPEGGSTAPTPINPSTPINTNPDTGIVGGGGGINLTPSKNGETDSNCDCVPYYLCKNNSIIKDGNGLLDIRMKGRCDNYFEYCCGAENKLEVPITTKPVEHPPGCGWRNPEGVGFRITHATDGEAEFAEFPWMAAVLREDSVEGSANKLNVYQCGGALIHPRVVITAAHCVTGKNLGKKYKIRAGEWDTQTRNEVLPHQDRDVETIITHEHFRSGTLYNDIALLILKEPVEITENVNVVCLPPFKQIVESQECFASGWGKDVFGKEGKYQVILKKVELPIVLHDRCQELLRKTRLGRHFELHSSFTCAGGIAGKDTCRGDGGSPLVCPIPGQKGRYFQAGIVAWGIGCGETDSPGVYANVAELRDWIDEQMQYQRLEQSSYSYQ